MAVAAQQQAKAGPAGATIAADVLVVLGIAGDLAKVMTFRLLYRLEAVADQLPDHRGPVSDWSLEDLRNHARSAIENTGEQIDARVFARFAGRLSYAQGDFGDAATFKRVRDAIGQAQQPVFYLEIPPFLFATVIKGLSEAGLTKHARVVVEKSFGHDLESARQLAADIHQYIDESQLCRTDHFLGKMGTGEFLSLRFANSTLEPVWNRNHIAAVEITMAEAVGGEDRGQFYDPLGTLSDVVVNHLMHLLGAAAMDPGAAGDPDSVKDARHALPVEARGASEAVCTRAVQPVSENRRRQPERRGPPASGGSRVRRRRRRFRRSPTTRSCRTVTPARCSLRMVRSTGCAFRALTRRACSARCSTAKVGCSALRRTG